MEKKKLITKKPFLIILFLFFTLAKSQLYDQEHQTLLQIKQKWKNPSSLDHWTNSSSHCKWKEITCTENSVTEMQLGNMNITETIPGLICDLKNLTLLNLQWNYIPGPFPTVLYNCSKLRYLDISQNYFDGEIPDSIYRLGQLQSLILSANNFYGNIPAAIGQLSSLTELWLDYNLFNGTFPEEIGNLSNLEMLNMNNNQFAPSNLFGSFTKLKKLKNFWMSSANLISSIPEMMGEMVSLESLDLSNNSLTGKIPSSLFELENLSFVYLYQNGLSGELPPIKSSYNLTLIDFSDNNLTGKIPDTYGDLKKLSELDLFFNNLSGEIPYGLGRIPKLTIVKLFSNSFSGNLPPDFGRYSMLVEFQVSENNFSGNLPENLCYGGELIGVVADNNNLTGELPASLGNCSKLTTVSALNNSLSGKVPAGLWKSENLSYVLLNDNMFTGQLPDKMPYNLTTLDIRNNRFSGGIPTTVSEWVNLTVFRASNNLFNGSIPKEITALSHLTTLLLDQNQLSDKIPSDIISWKSLAILHLNHNQLSGEIPEAIGNLPVLSDLDLSENQLSGQIPTQLGSLPITNLNLSSNQLTGEIPAQLDILAYSSSFLNNSGLCSKSQNLNISTCNSKTQEQTKKSSSKQLYRVLIALCTAIAVVFSVLLFFMIRNCRKRNGNTDSKWKITPFQKLSFTEESILSGLKESNEIGNGGSGKVYRVAVNSSGNLVAVKKILNNSKLDHQLDKEFLAEIQTLGTIRHINIVKLLCCISSETSKLLVYEYLVNHSLDQWLQKKRRKVSAVSGLLIYPVLDWPTRLRIAIGAARGLSYMHHDCVPPIVHRDVKSSNILLDSQFNAKIADFGLAKMLIQPEELATASTVAGSFGYMAPELVHTARVNEKVDVYSFGIVLLELTTGREASDGDEHAGLAEWACRHLQKGKNIIDALDKEINEACYLDEIISVFTLGIICSNTTPSSRPSMKEVLQVLDQCSYSLRVREKNGASENDEAPFLSDSKPQRMVESDDDCLV